MTKNDEPADAAQPKTPNAGPRPGGAAKGGNASQPEDPTNPRDAAARAKASNEEMKRRGFGDHKGEAFGSDGTG